jgi:hypothetical protein
MNPITKKIPAFLCNSNNAPNRDAMMRENTVFDEIYLSIWSRYNDSNNRKINSDQTNTLIIINGVEIADKILNVINRNLSRKNFFERIIQI